MIVNLPAFLREPRLAIVLSILPSVIIAACSPYARAKDGSKAREDAVDVRILTEALDSVMHPCSQRSSPALEDEDTSPPQVFAESVLYLLGRLPASTR
jgi:hypothetical protein